MIASLVRILGFALLVLAALASARPAPSPQASVPAPSPQASVPVVANNVATPKSFIRPIHVNNNVAACTAFLAGEGCGSEIQLGPFETIDKPATCVLSQAAIKCGQDAPFINCNIDDLVSRQGDTFSVEGFAGDKCTLARSQN